MGILNMMLGRGQGVADADVDIFDTTASDTEVVSPADATATYQLSSGGGGTRTGGAGWTWLLDGVNSDYAVRAVVLSGGTPNLGSTLGAWLVMSTTRSWGHTKSGLGIQEIELEVTIRRVSDSVEIDTAIVTITVEVVAE